MVLPTREFTFRFIVEGFVKLVFIILLPERDTQESNPLTFFYPLDEIRLYLSTDYMRLPLELATANALCLLDVYLHCSSAGIDVYKFPCSSEGGVGTEQKQGVISKLRESKGMIAYSYALVLGVLSDEPSESF